MNITDNRLQKAYTYSAYRQMIDNLMEQGKTTGTNQSEDYIAYARMNQHRMERLEKTTVLNDELNTALTQLKQPYTWLVLTEGWCGDAAQILPVMNKIAESSDNIQLKLVLRDENLDIMDEFLTNGSRSIPKLIVLDKDWKVVANWGPRPAEVQALMLEMKHAGVDAREKGEKIHAWYAKDKTQSTQKELADLIRHLDQH